MNLRSLACRTDLIFHRFDGEISDRGDYLVVKTPEIPGYFFGNFLLFPQAPQAGDYAHWCLLFDREFKENPRVRHRTFLWDSIGDDAGEIQPFLDNGYIFEKSVVLTAATVRKPEKSWAELQIRPIRADSDWQKVVECQIQCKQDEFDPERYREFKVRQMGRYRRMAEAGLGFWFGAFHEDRLVADLGIFFDGKIGRFQSVETHPSFRRKGACGTLVYEASRFVMLQHGIEKLVMVADPEYHAARIYESVGFLPTEKAYAIYWFNRSEWQKQADLGSVSGA